MIEGKLVWTENPINKLEGLRQSIKNRAIRTALSKAASGVKAAVIENAPIHFGFLRKSIRIKIKSYQGKTVWVAIVGAKSDYIRFKGKRTRGKNKGEKIKYRPAMYLRLVSEGTKHAKGSHFMQRALESSITQYQATLCQAVKEQVEKYMKK